MPFVLYLYEFFERLQIIVFQEKDIKIDLNGNIERQVSLKSKKLSILNKAIKNNLQVNIVYKSFIGEKTRRTIKPLSLFQKEKRWYLRAYCQLRKAEREFRVSKLKIVE